MAWDVVGRKHEKPDALLAEDSARVKFPPPFIYLIGLVLGLIISRYIPVRVIPAAIVLPLGIALLIAWIALSAPALASFFRVRTPLSPNKPTAALVTSGVFSITRNPLYLGLVALYLAIAVLTNSLWAIVLIIPVVVIVRVAVIDREERYLERKFGREYTDYKQRVRRWL